MRALLAAGLALALVLVVPGGAAAQGEPTPGRPPNAFRNASSPRRARCSSASPRRRGGGPGAAAHAVSSRAGSVPTPWQPIAPFGPRSPRARRAVGAGDEVALAAARGRLRAALLRGSYDVTIAAVRAGHAARARDWLLLREFRQATRFTRPSVDATLAVRELPRRRKGAAPELCGVRADLLDAYQARLTDRARRGRGRAERGFTPGLAEIAAMAQGCG